MNGAERYGTSHTRASRSATAASARVMTFTGTPTHACSSQEIRTPLRAPLLRNDQVRDAADQEQIAAERGSEREHGA